MKKKSASRSAFFNLRVLIGLSVVLVGVLLALASSDVFSVAAQNVIHTMTMNRVITYSTDPLVPVGFDCSKIHELGIDKQENFRAGAIMEACGEVPGVATSATATLGPIGYFIKRLLLPLAYGAGDVNLITGTETSPNITQSETFTTVNPDDPNQVFVAYNDSRGRNASPINISGASISTDGGTTFTRITTAGGQSPFAATVGDPVALYNKPTGTWFTVWLDTACGAQGLGGYKSATPANAASWTHFCIHNSSGDDRESGWADNDPASPFYGRMYISWGNGGALSATYSSDNGLTWHAPIQIAPASPFIRDVQITGDLSGNGVLYVAGMNEGGGGFPHNDINHIFKSTDGGNTWTHPYTGPTFPGPGVTAVGYFACMFSDGGGYWRHEGWGEPAALNNVVHLVYAQHGTGADPGDVYYIRSTDGGATFAAPFKLNTDATTRPQWQPNLSVSPTGTLLATWYDARESASCTRGNPAVPCYRMWSRKSNDNGATWLIDDAFSDVVTPLPAQPDSGIQATYAGDYDYGSAVATKHVTSWTDGRVAINAASQQDAFTDREPAGNTPTPTPTATFTPTPAPTATFTPIPTATATATFTPTPTATATFTPTPSTTATFTPTPTATATFTPTPITTATATATATASFTPTPTASATFTPTASSTATFTPIPTATATFTPTPTSTQPPPTPTATATFTPTPTATATATFTPTSTATATFTPTPTSTQPPPTPTATATFTPTPTATATATFTPTSTATATFTPTPTSTQPPPTATATFTPTPTATASATATATLTPTATATSTATATATFTPLPTPTFTPTATATATPTSTPRPTPTARPQPTPRARPTPAPRP